MPTPPRSPRAPRSSRTSPAPPVSPHSPPPPPPGPDSPPGPYSLTFHWFLPTSGDSRHVVGGGHGSAVTSTAGDRPPSVDYLALIAGAAEQLGFEGALTPTGTWCEDAWLTTAMVSQRTDRLKFLVAFRPGFLSPTLAAQMAATYQRQTGGRLLLNVVTGGESQEQRAYGDFLDKDARYARTGEFLDVVRGLWRGETVSLRGDHLRVEDATLTRPPRPVPPVYFGGSSPAAIEVAARTADVYLTWGEPPALVAEKIQRVRERARELGRGPGEPAGPAPRFGVRLHTISRDTSEAAWAEARRLLDGFDPATIRTVQDGLRRSDSEGQRRMLALHGGRRDGLASGGRDGLEIHPGLWAGVGLVRGGAGTALVGSHQEVAELIQEYRRVGVEEFVLSGYPHLEEAYWFGEGVLPLLRRASLWSPPGAAPDAPETPATPAAASAGPNAPVTAGTAPNVPFVPSRTAVGTARTPG
ncbi:LLM class flavin-dependent oxidoreductase [Streptomyces sp. AJS327]|uniref:LLM class flavin-dependent oxidoreductase n=1 Tax=Streptomyces sp. AJS327 TaxID=2545265 RepID=UPI0015DFD862|nr:LLM class flavin-dependent oxidoreductase [Streptomyces sp. AJS327]MBA0053393.1 LLM class flavin-dependent oxidoreductase [Streptomyces sp. AJS327]